LIGADVDILVGRRAASDSVDENYQRPQLDQLHAVRVSRSLLLLLQLGPFCSDAARAHKNIGRRL